MNQLSSINMSKCAMSFTENLNLRCVVFFFSSSTENSSTKTYNQQITETVILARQARPFEIFIKHSSMCENELLSSL